MCIPPEKHSLPQFLEQNKDICLSIKQYARENLHKLSIEFLSEYLHDVILPKMVKESYALEPNSEGYEQSLLELLKKYNLTCISPLTITRWMEKLGFKYEQRKKGYYVGVNGRKDAFGNLQHDTSLKYLLGNCTDFEEEESMLS